MSGSNLSEGILVWLEYFWQYKKRVKIRNSNTKVEKLQKTN